jgi:2-succinyl-5-enolpyruvyl-6-hydroxy-3-cyclohexene-1-carboxylate synthase
MSDAAAIQSAFAATLVDEWVRSGVTDAVVAPGSRSTPLTWAMAADERLRLHVVVDERSAGFLALGLGVGSGRPAVVVTTSGTAAVELHPAVVEAHQAGVPLIAVTADRPAELHGVGAPQTVEQDRLYGGAVRWSASPGVAEGAAAGTWRSLACRAVLEAAAGPWGPGPVHLNLAFREPLLASPAELPAGRPGGRPWHAAAPRSGAPAPEEVVELLARPGRRGVIVAGEGAGDAGEVHAAAAALGWPVLAEPRSGCRVPAPTTVAAACCDARRWPGAGRRWCCGWAGHGHLAWSAPGSPRPRMPTRSSSTPMASGPTPSGGPAWWWGPTPASCAARSRPRPVALRPPPGG